MMQIISCRSEEIS